MGDGGKKKKKKKSIPMCETEESGNWRLTPESTDADEGCELSRVDC